MIWGQCSPQVRREAAEPRREAAGAAGGGSPAPQAVFMCALVQSAQLWCSVGTLYTLPVCTLHMFTAVHGKASSGSQCKPSAHAIVQYKQRIMKVLEEAEEQSNRTHIHQMGPHLQRFLYNYNSQDRRLHFLPNAPCLCWVHSSDRT